MKRVLLLIVLAVSFASAQMTLKPRSVFTDTLGARGTSEIIACPDTIKTPWVRNTNQTFAEVYIADDHPDSITVSTTDVYYTIGAKQGANGYAWTTGGYTQNSTISDSSITVTKAGIYRVSWSISVSSYAMGGGTKANAYVFINDVIKAKGGALRFLSGTNDLGNFGASSLFYLAANDILKLKIRSVDDGTGTLIIWYANFNLNRID